MLLWGSADLDYFKTVNDYWSHAHGDFAIIRTARTIAEVVEEWSDPSKALCVPFRMGGDEFAFAFLAPLAMKREKVLATVRDFCDRVCVRVTKMLRERFDFGSREPKPVDRMGRPITAAGPSVSIGVSSALRCDEARTSIHTAPPHTLSAASLCI